MLPTNLRHGKTMGWTNIQYETIDYDPNLKPTHKSIWDGEQFVTRTIYHVPITRLDEAGERAKWLNDTFGHGRTGRNSYDQNGYWAVGPTRISMEEKVYTMYRLRWG